MEPMPNSKQVLVHSEDGLALTNRGLVVAALIASFAITVGTVVATAMARDQTFAKKADIVKLTTADSLTTARLVALETRFATRAESMNAVNRLQDTHWIEMKNRLDGIEERQYLVLCKLFDDRSGFCREALGGRGRPIFPPQK
jgi:hypothetical protein